MEDSDFEAVGVVVYFPLVRPRFIRNPDIDMGSDNFMFVSVVVDLLHEVALSVA